MTLLLLQMTAILLTVLICGWIARKLGQPRVVGEIAGGILLGPSLLGRVAPGAFALLFPQSSLSSFGVLSTLGLVLFLFLIGSQLNLEHLGRQRATATLASGMSILLPFLLAAAIAPSLMARFMPEGVASLPFELFLGVSMSITALPVLGRILEERQIQSTSLGTTALMCAAVDDVVAWSVLALALTFLPQSGVSGSESLSLTVRLLWLGVYLAIMLGLILPLGKWMDAKFSKAALSLEAFAILMVLVLASAAATDAIGLHPFFGAFLAGICFPRRPEWQAKVRARLDTVVSVLLLPFFFAMGGMQTRLDLLCGVEIWLWTAIVLVVAVAGKMGGAVLAARWTGQSWQNAWALGALLNTRGLVELIVLNVAYSAHVFSPALYTMLVVMALITTMMTAPLLNLIGIPRAGHGESESA